VDLVALFTPTQSLLDLVIRGSVVYLFLFILFRFVRRGTGALQIPDILLIVLVADAAQNAMANEYKSITEGIILVSTLAGWNILLDWLSFKSIFFERLIRAPAVPLIRNGKLDERNMRRQMITRGELQSQMRLQGVDAISDVKKCCLEPDGKISVEKFD